MWRKKEQSKWPLWVVSGLYLPNRGHSRRHSLNHAGRRRTPPRRWWLMRVLRAARIWKIMLIIEDLCTVRLRIKLFSLMPLVLLFFLLNLWPRFFLFQFSYYWHTVSFLFLFILFKFSDLLCCRYIEKLGRNMVWSIQRKKFCIDTEELIVNLGVNLVSGSFLLLFDPFPIFAISFVILINSRTSN